MKYYVAISTFNNPLPVESEELNTIIQQHLSHLQKGFDEGWILFSGPKVGSGGGVIIMKAETQNEVDEYFAADPMKKAGVQNYEITEFKLHKSQNNLSEWFE
jgi:uncharacterized protein YciI